MLTSLGKREAGRRDRLNWRHIDMIRRKWKGKLLIKGVLDRGDARMARESGLDGVMVSNHGGRQLDGATAPLRVLPGIVEEARGQMAVTLDSGVRRGTDVLKALALGATAVGIGRPYVWGLAAFGEPGVDRVLEILDVEFITIMRQVGALNIGQITRENVGPA